MTMRMLPSTSAKTTTIINDRTYTAALGTTADVPNWDASELASNGWFTAGIGYSVGVGTTAARPTDALFAGACYTDTTLGYVVVYDGASWRNPVSGASV